MPVGKGLLQPLEDPGSLLRTGLVENLLEGGDLTRAEEDARPAQTKHLRRDLGIPVVRVRDAEIGVNILRREGGGGTAQRKTIWATETFPKALAALVLDMSNREDRGSETKKRAKLVLRVLAVMPYLRQQQCWSLRSTSTFFADTVCTQFLVSVTKNYKEHETQNVSMCPNLEGPEDGRDEGRLRFPVEQLLRLLRIRAQDLGLRHRSNIVVVVVVVVYIPSI